MILQLGYRVVRADLAAVIDVLPGHLDEVGTNGEDDGVVDEATAAGCAQAAVVGGRSGLLDHELLGDLPELEVTLVLYYFELEESQH